MSETFGQYLKVTRESCGWSLQDLSNRAEISRAQLHNIEHGRSSPSLDTLQSIAKAFNLGAGDMLVQAGYTVNSDAPVMRAFKVTIDVGVMGSLLYIETQTNDKDEQREG